VGIVWHALMYTRLMTSSRYSSFFTDFRTVNEQKQFITTK